VRVLADPRAPARRGSDRGRIVSAARRATREGPLQAAELMVSCLESEGVERIFAIPGEETLEIVEALRESSIDLVIVRHEQGAAFMADVHGRLTGRAGVCLGTLGPGATNLITGVGDAYLDYAPMVAITGQVRLDLVHKESHQYVDVVDMLRPVTKWNTRIERPETVPEVVRKAFKLAEAERPGPAHLELSETIAAAQLPSSLRPLAQSRPGPRHPDPAVVREAAAIVRSADRPVILTGNGTIRARAARELRALCEHAGIPACPTFMGKGALDDRSLLSLPAVGVQARDSVTAGLDEADVVVCVGYDLVEFGPEAWNADRPKRIVHVDARAAEVDADYIPEVELVGDIGESLRQLRDELPPGPMPAYATRLRVAVTTELRATVERPGFVSPQAAILAIRAAMRPSDILISDVGAHKLWLGRLFPAYEPNTVIISNGFATMGIGLPGAIAAALALPERRAVTVSGDGGFLMNVQEMETATRLGLRVVVVVWVDGAYGVIGWKQERRFGRTHAIHFGNPDWAGLAASFGWDYRHATDGGGLRSTLESALAGDGPTLITVPIDYRQNVRLASLGEPALGA
jgi:acetolactate synthase I/II/III large subunit